MKNKEETTRAGRVTRSSGSISSPQAQDKSPEKKSTRPRRHEIQRTKSKEDIQTEELERKKSKKQPEENTKKRKAKEIEQENLPSPRETRFKRREELRQSKEQAEMDENPDNMDLDESMNEEMEDGDKATPELLLRTLMRQVRGGGMHSLQNIGRLSTVIQGLRSGDETHQMVSLQELCEVLSMGTEETLAGFNVDEFVPALLDLLNLEHNPEIMLFSCRCLSNLIEALPGSSLAIIAHGGVPMICSKLLNIEYIDLAEQALVTIEKMSLESPAAIVRAGGLNAVLSYLDFFPLGVQRSAVNTASNLCKNFPINSYDMLGDSVTVLVNLLRYHDNKIVEKACVSLVRLVDSFSGHPERLKSISSGEFLKNMIFLISPSNTSPPPHAIFTMVVRMFGILCKNCPVIAVELVGTEILSILNDALAGGSNTPMKQQQQPSNKESPMPSPQVVRSSEQAQEILTLLCELLPILPKVDIFLVENNPPPSPPQATPTPTAESPDQSPRSLRKKKHEEESESKSKERKKEKKDREKDKDKDKDKEKEKDKDKDKEKEKEKDKEKEKEKEKPKIEKLAPEIPDPRLDALEAHPDLMLRICQSFIQILMDCYSSSVSSVVRAKSVMIINKIIYFSKEEVLEQVLKDIAFSSFLAGLLSSKDQNIVVMAIQICHTLLLKLSKIFIMYFRREGVVFELENLTKAPENITVPPPPSTSVQSPISPDQARSISKLSGLFKKSRDRVRDELEPRTPGGISLDFSMWISKRSTQILESFFEKSSKSNNQLDELRNLSEQLKVSSSESSWYEILSKISVFFADSGPGISSFELQQSGLIESLRDFFSLSNQKRSEKLKIFICLFMHGPLYKNLTRQIQDGSPFLNVVRKTQECLTKHENFMISIHEILGSDPKNPISALKIVRQAFKISLQKMDPADNIKEMSDNIISIEPLASIHAIELFLRQRALANKPDREEARRMSQRQRNDSEVEDISVEKAETQTPAPNTSTSDDQPVIEILMGDKILPRHMTVLQAIEKYSRNTEPGQQATFSFNTIYQFKYRLAKSQPTEEESSQSSLCLTKTKEGDFGMSDLGYILDSISLGKETSDKIVALCLDLLKILNAINSFWKDAYGFSDSQIETASVVPSNEFVNAKISAKLSRQLQDPLSICRPNLPDWCDYLTYNYSFLFPFECRYIYLYSTSFGMSRALLKLQERTSDGQPDSQEARIGRTQRQKVRIMRSKILESAIKVMDLYASSKSMIEIEYFEEVGTGLGPTLEFYTTASKEFRKKSLKMWRTSSDSSQDEYVFMPCGLFPRPMSIKESSSESGKSNIKLFQSFGSFVAKALLDFRTLDLPLSHVFFKCALQQYGKLSIRDLSEVDPSLFRSIVSLNELCLEKSRINSDSTLTEKEKKVKVEEIKMNGASFCDLLLDFTLPGFPDIELKPNGSSIDVNIHNLEEYIDLVLKTTLVNSVQKQIDAFITGFNIVFPIQKLRIFTPSEIDVMMNGAEEIWEKDVVLDAIKCDHGYTSQSPAIQKLVTTMSEFTPTEQRQFLTFITGSPRLPVGGLKSLSPSFTVVKRSPEGGHSPDDYLPSAMTCANYLKLPDYSTNEIMKAKLTMAMTEGQGSFHLS